MHLCTYALLTFECWKKLEEGILLNNYIYIII